MNNKIEIADYIVFVVCFALLGFVAYVWVNIAIPQIAERLVNMIISWQVI